METLLTTWQNLQSMRMQALVFLAHFFGREVSHIRLMIYIILGYIVLFAVLVPLHKRLKKQQLRLQKSIVTQIDEMLYLLAKYQHLQHENLQSLGGNPHLALMKTIFTQGAYDYLKSSGLILENVRKVEQLLWAKVVSSQQESQLFATIKQHNRFKFWQQLLKVIIAIPTAGLYLLFA